jgi:1,2-diacylglycerol 3-beta-glucosyltransferase
VLYVFALTLVIVGLGYLVVTLALSRVKKPIRMRGFDPELFVFVVPALDEERVIGRTVLNLLAACGDRGRVVVVNDGSADRTAEILAMVGTDRVSVLERRAPNARHGKGAALNEAYRFIRHNVLAQGIDPQQVVVGIVDADGRLEADALERVSPYFRDPGVGAVQLLVRIRNRARWLARFQDYEFLVFSSLTQTAREKLGSVGLGGNGQFTRLAALMDLGDDPWTACLTEDLDLGVRLAVAGWENRFCGETYVDQQGLTSIRSLVRQRTRWAQGHFQCWRLLPRIARSDLPTTTVLDMSYYLIAPAMVLVQSLVFSLGWAWFAYEVAGDPGTWLSPRAGVYLALMYLISMGPGLYLTNIYRRRSTELSLAQGFAMAHLLVLYNYLWYAAEWRAIWRILRRRSGWVKTARASEGAEGVFVT